MNLPDMNIFMFEYWIEVALAAHITALGIINPAKQRDDNGLITPRVEVKTIWGGWETERRYVEPNTKAVWFDMGRGKMVLRCVTSRQDTSQSHTRLVGSLRYAMQIIFETPGYTPGQPGSSSPLTLSDRMPYHRFARVVDTGATPSFTPNQQQDVTALGFDFVIQIRPTAFPTS